MRRTTTAILATTGVIALALMPQAHAEAPIFESYAAGASSTSFALEILGEGIAISHTNAGVKSTPAPTAAANGAAGLLAGNPVPGDAPVEATEGQDVSARSGEPCDVLDPLTEELGGADMTVDITCVDTNAKVAGAAPSASSAGGTVDIQIVGLSEGALAPLGDALVQVLTPVLTPASDAVDTLCDPEGPLGPLTGTLCTEIEGGSQIDLPGLVDEIVADVLQIGNGDFVLAQISIGAGSSAARANEQGVLAEAGSGLVTVSLFPGLAFAIEQLTGLVDGTVTAESSLLTLPIGRATAKVVRDPVTGAPSAEATRADLLAGPTLTDNLGIIAELVEVEVPALVEQLTQPLAALSCDGGALAPVVCVDLGAVNELDDAELTARGLNFGAGTVGREASAARIEVLGALVDAAGAPLLELELAQATAAANAVLAAPVESSTPQETDRSLPETGAESGLPVALALLAVAAIGGTLVRRSRTA